MLFFPQVTYNKKFIDYKKITNNKEVSTMNNKFTCTYMYQRMCFYVHVGPKSSFISFFTYILTLKLIVEMESTHKLAQ